MPDAAQILISATFLAPGLATALLGTWLMLSPRRPSERAIIALTGAGLWASVAASLAVLGLFAAGLRGEVEVGEWIRLGSYVVPIVYSVDRVAVVFSVLASVSTALVLRFSTTYLHLEPGFARFFVLLGLFGTGIQLVAFAGALDLMFAGWELLGISSALFIGYFWERAEPANASLRAFATYRLCDVGFFLGIVSVHELLGTTRLSVFEQAAHLEPLKQTLVAAMFLLPALGKSAQLPFSSWLPRALEGPTPSSALFYGALSVHAGMYLLLRIHPLLDAAPAIEGLAIAVGLVTAAYGALVARVQADAKGALAFATLTQTGLILAEIAAGFTTLALVHLVGHALLRLAQYLRAPNILHDTHQRGHAGPSLPLWERTMPAGLRRWLYAGAIHRFRLDDGVDVAIAPVLSAARGLAAVDGGYRRWLSVGPAIAGGGGAGVARRLGVAALLAAAVAAPDPTWAYGALAVAVAAIGAGTGSRTGVAWLGLAAATFGGAAGAFVAGASPEVVFGLAVGGLGIVAGVLPLHVGAMAIAESRPAVLVELAAATFAAVFLHLGFVIPAAGAVAHDAAVGIVAWGAVAALAGALLGLVQSHLRGLWGSSVAMHAGMTLAAVGAAGRGHQVAALFVAITFALALGGFGALVAALEARVGPVRFGAGGGRVRALPILAAAFAIYAAAGVALPGTAGFVADDLLLHALWEELPAACALVLAASAILAISLLRGFVAVFLGPERLAPVATDLDAPQRVAAVVGIVALLGLGLYPMGVIARAAPAADHVETDTVRPNHSGASSMSTKS